MSTAPRSTYRLQIHAGFTLHDAAELVDYLAALGVDWVYVSPLLQAESGSTHGYDTVDPSRVDPDRGGDAGLRALSEAAHAAGLGLLVDIVPNHMGVATPKQNPWWWHLLTHGRASRYADAFDIDWDAGDGRLLIPVLGSESLDDLEIVDGELVYFDHRLPIAPGTADDGADARTVHDRQHYRLVYWKHADDRLNYRRFFAVNTLAAIRVEDPAVFDESHSEIVRWAREGLVDGLRVDHPDGLLDPGAYLDALTEATGLEHVLVEKILEGDEPLPAHWRTVGTTGYDALGDLDRLLVDPAGQARLDALDAELRGAPAPDWHDLIHDTKRSIADGILGSEIQRLARLVPDIPGADDALAEIAACFPVYRSYLPYGADHLAAALADAARRRPELAATLDALAPVIADPEHPAARRLQQTTGMVMAKGVEDTAFYRYTRLTSLTEVGGDPHEFAIDAESFHRRSERRQAQRPRAMTTHSTHDTKRGEDVRARIDVLSEVPDEWAELLGSLRAAAPVGDGPFENLLWQAIVGAWPIERERAHGYAEKASREAGNSTTWTAPDDDFESRMHQAVDAAYDDPAVTAAIEAFVARIAPAGWSNSLTSKLFQLAGPGVPDVYQGSELWETSLVDPDNRRPVDFDDRRGLLAKVYTGGTPRIDGAGVAKMLLTARALRSRHDRPGSYDSYLPLSAVGAAADHVVAFDRGGAIAVGTRLPVGLERSGGWRDTELLLPRRPMIEVLTGRRFEGGSVPVADLLTVYPVALLEDLT